MKRDDLLRAGIGSKVRKFDALIPLLKERNIKRIGVITSPYGSNSYAAPAMLLPHGFKVYLIHPETRSAHHQRFVKEPLGGNAFLSSMFIPSSQRIWLSHIRLAKSCDDLLRKWNDEDGGHSIILPEGIATKGALCGAVQLGRELADQAPSTPVVYLDAGTGHTAAGVIFAMHLLRHRAHITVVGPCAPEQIPDQYFSAKLSLWKSDFDSIASEELGHDARGTPR